MAQMTKDAIVQACKANKGYGPPHLNDQIFLHCKGFMKVENLEAYTELKALWLEQNSIADVRGLGAQQKLASLFLHNNALMTLKNYDAPLSNLRMLNISHNYLTSLRGLAGFCPILETLQASHNHITSLEACEDLWGLSATLTSVDLSFNKIEQYNAPTEEGESRPEGAALVQPAKDPSAVVRFFEDHLPLVSVIYLQGNAITHGMKHYRRQMILHLPALTYLDERPVFVEERRIVTAWGTGGEEAESAERALIREEKKQHLSSCVRILTDKMEGNRAVRDRLTRQWKERRDMELELLTQRRREMREAKTTLEGREVAQRSVLEREADESWWGLMDAFEEEHQAMLEDERTRRRAYEQRLEVERVTREAQQEIEQEEEAALQREAVGAHVLQEGSAYFDLVRSDEDIFNEMEEEIQNVLNQVDVSIHRSAAGAKEASAGEAQDPNANWLAAREAGHFDRHTAKAERRAHAAVRTAAARVMEEERRRQAAREERWNQFAQWEARFMGGRS
eukprot:gene13341-9173_t